MASFNRQLADTVAEEGPQSFLGAPHRRRSQAGRRRSVLGRGPEHLSNLPFRCPVRETYLAARAANAKQFGRGFGLIGREHHAKGRKHHIETGVIEGQGLGIAFDEPAPGYFTNDSLDG